jgi:hypothetical protein
LADGEVIMLERGLIDEGLRRKRKRGRRRSWLWFWDGMG